MLAARHRARLTMEERNMDLQEDIKFRNVRRRLFSDDDDDKVNNGRSSNGENDNIANRLFEEVRQHREDAKKRWNFDFENEVPLSGDYEWVKLDCDGNEISDSVRSNNEVNKSRGEQPKCDKEKAGGTDESKTDNRAAENA